MISCKFLLQIESDDDDLESAITLLHSGRQLLLPDVNVDDTGSYSCQASNIAGQSSLLFNVLVLREYS